MISMVHEIAQAIIENGQSKHINKRLSRKRMKVRLTYDDVAGSLTRTKIARITGETSGIYSKVDVETESRKLRKTWERNVHH